MKERGNKTLRALDRWLGIPILFLLGVFRRHRKLPRMVHSVGLLMLGAIGDTLLASSLIDDLRVRFPGVRIVGFISSANQGIEGIIDGVDEYVLVPVTSPHRAVRAIRTRTVDLLIDFGQWARISAILSALSKARFTVGLRKAGQYRHFAYDIVSPQLNDRHELENFRGLVRCIGIFPQGQPRIRRDALLSALSVELPKPFIVFHPWAAGYRHDLREWPPALWLELAHTLVAVGYAIVITGGPGDRKRSEALASLADNVDGSALHVLAGSITLAQTVRVLAEAAAVISVNTGIMHVAAALGCPLVALHGPTNPRRWGPLSNCAVIVGPGADKGGAYLDLGYEYPLHAKNIMENIEVKDVLNGLANVLPTATALGHKLIKGISIRSEQ
ncbi:MAG: glycosyltransferase family 9 protein [Acidimicrobiaceae bacterium]|nr:glycosyltransferase family 9 protein [Acidimicrobiaceae bacterium]